LPVNKINRAFLGPDENGVKIDLKVLIRIIAGWADEVKTHFKQALSGNRAFTLEISPKIFHNYATSVYVHKEAGR
jgi:hypothetical protein